MQPNAGVDEELEESEDELDELELDDELLELDELDDELITEELL